MIFFVKRGMFCLVVCLFVEFLEINVLVGSSEVGEWDEQQTIDSSYLFRRLLCGDWK